MRENEGVNAQVSANIVHVCQLVSREILASQNPSRFRESEWTANRLWRFHVEGRNRRRGRRVAPFACHDLVRRIAG